MVSVFFFLQKHKIAHGDIRPANVLLTKNGVVKIADINFINEESSIYYKLFSHSNIENHYVSPEIIESLNKKLLKTYHNSYKSDIYSFGMTMLEAATLEYSSICYDYDKFAINYLKVKNLLDSLKNRYSIFFINFLTDMLQEKEKYRPNFEDLHSLLLPFQSKKKDIYSNQNFVDEKSKKNDKNQISFVKQNEIKGNSYLRNLHKRNLENIPNLNRKSILKVNDQKNYSMSNQTKSTNQTNFNEITNLKNEDFSKIHKNQESDFLAQIKIETWQEENCRLNEIERKINEALRLSEETIKMHSY